ARPRRRVPRSSACSRLAERRSKEAVRGARAPDKGAGHLRLTSETWPVEYGNLLDARAQCGGLDDHLRGPAEGAIAHAEAPEQVHADGAERADVREVPPV